MHRRVHTGELVCLLILVIGVLPTVGAVTYILARGLQGISLEFLTAMPRQQGIEGGILPAIVGTLWLMLGTSLLVLPLGVAAGIYLAEFAPRNWLTDLLEMALVNLSGVPSVVFGLFGYALFVTMLGFGSSLLSAALTLGALTLPLLVTATRQALKGVPQSFRDAALALGATQWQSVSWVVLPCAKGGIITGSFLGLARAAGETAPILVTGVAFFLPRLPSSFMSRFMALPYHLYIIATQVPGMAVERMWATAAVLLVFVMTMQTGAIVWRQRERRYKKW